MTDWPITLQEAAKKIHASERWLRGHLKMNPSGRKSGRRIIFTESDYQELLSSLETMEKYNARKSDRAYHQPTMSAERAKRKVIKMLTESKHKAVEKRERRKR